MPSLAARAAVPSLLLCSALVACSGGSTPEERQHGELLSQMHADLAAVTTARDALIVGDLDGAASPLAQFASHDIAEALPELWVPYYELMQDYAGEISEERDVVVLAEGLSMLAGMCGDCHEANAGGPLITTVGVPPLDGSFTSRMQRHAWAADRMWEGLVTPDEERWLGGAAAMLEDPMRPEDLEGHVPWPDEMEVFESYLYDLGEDGIHAANSGTRSEVYGQFLATCASCHSASGM